MRGPNLRSQSLIGAFVAVLALVATLALLAGLAPSARAQAGGPSGESELVNLDFNDVELNVVIDTISRMTGYNFIYDDRVRGRVTIVSPTEVTVDQAFAVFESVLKVKGFSLVLGPGNTYKVIPIRDVKESSIDTIQGGGRSPNRDRFVTRLIPLRFIDAEAITNTIKPLVSKDALIVAYQPTNTIIVTDSESNIRRLMQILDAIDVESFRQELAVIKIEHADAATLGDQLSEIYGGSVTAQAGGANAGQRRARARQAAAAGQVQNGVVGAPGTGAIGPEISILPDERTNSLLIMASRQQIEDIRGLIDKLDVPVRGQGRIQVYYLKFADSEELADTLNSLLGSGGGSSGGGGRSPLPGAASNAMQNLRSTVTPLSEGVTITADPATNALVIQASKEAYETLRQVIEKLDVSRPQVLVEALIVEVDVTDALNLGFSAAYRFVNGDVDMLLATGVTSVVPGAGLVSQIVKSPSFTNPGDIDDVTKPAQDDGRNVQIGVTASKSNNDVNIVSAPHILTSDNEEAEIKIGQNIPIISGTTQAPTTTAGAGSSGLAVAQSVQRQDVGVTLRVTPQISEGDTLRMEIFQELTEVAESAAGADVNKVGPTLTSRKVENTVVVHDGETVAIGGLISEVFSDNVNGVPWLADIPFLGWAFKTKGKNLRKINLIVFLTPHIVRSAEDLEQNTIRKRIELEDSTDEDERRHYPELAKVDKKHTSQSYAAADKLNAHAERYPVERMQELERKQVSEREARAEKARRQAEAGIQRYVIDVATYVDETEATEQLVTLIDAGYDGSLSSRESNGRVVFTIQVGPFEDLWEAEQAAQTLDEAYGFESTVALQRREEP
ncbi:MAG: type II secretion system secretin GspD [Myxococcota bacterium]